MIGITFDVIVTWAERTSLQISITSNTDNSLPTEVAAVHERACILLFIDSILCVVSAPRVSKPAL